MSTKHKILVVDDEQDIQELIAYNLNKEGYQVFTASNGKQAIQKAKEVNPDLIILDVMMPVMDGIEHAVSCGPCQNLNRLSWCFLRRGVRNIQKSPVFMSVRMTILPNRSNPGL